MPFDLDKLVRLNPALRSAIGRNDYSGIDPEYRLRELIDYYHGDFALRRSMRCDVDLNLRRVIERLKARDARIASR